MSHPLERKIATLRSRVRRLVMVYGVSWVVAALLSTVIVLGMTDYVIRFRDPGLRVICSLLWLAALGWVCYRYLYVVLLLRLRNVDLALRVQRRFPALGDGLVSAVEFLGQSEDDPAAGSAALRRAVIAQTTAETDRLDFSQVVDPRPPLRAAASGVAICLVAAILVVLDPYCSRIAVARLINPFGSAAWPQKTHLKFRQRITRIARGQPFEVEVVDARPHVKLPPAVQIHYRFEGPDAAVTEESEPMRLIGGAMVARRENVSRPFSYRAEGGDDHSMSWIAVEVVEPPRLESLSIRLVSPPYTGWPPEKTDKHIRALVGTRIEIEGKTTKPLRSVRLCFDGGVRIGGRVGDDGYRFTLPERHAPPLLVEQSGSYWFELTDREGLSGGEDNRWEIRAVADAPPSVTIERPTANLFVTSQAVVPLRVAAKDDLAIARIDLVPATSENPQQDGPRPQQSLPLYAGPPRVEPQGGGGLSGAAERGDRRVVEYRWDLQQLELAPGTVLSFHATAADYLPQTGQSEPRRLIVITAEELQERIAGRQGLILSELARVLKMQRGSRSQVGSLEIRLGELGRLEQTDIDRLQAAELNQRQVKCSLTGRSEGVCGHVLALLADLENNRVDSPDVRRRMEGLLQEIERLDREHLSLIGRELTAAIKAAEVRLQEQTSGAKPDSAVAASLDTGGKHQDQVIASLERMLGQLAQWDNYRRFHREIGQLLREQEEVGRRTNEVGRRTLTKELRDLNPQESADLKIVAGRQRELARQFDRIQQEMEEAAGRLRQSDPLAAETVADALDEARRLAVSGRMRSAGGNLQRNRIGQAVDNQKQIARDLQEVLDVLANRRQHELARLVKKLAEAEGDLAEIQRRQAGLREQLDRTAEDPDASKRRAELQRLARQQEELQQEAQRMARRLQRLLADRAGQTTRQAAAQMGQAGKAAGEGNAPTARSRAALAEEALEQARRQLAARRFQAQAELAVEQLARLEDELKHLHKRQQQLVGETERYEGIQQEAGRLSRAQTAGLRDLARQQQSLRQQIDRLAEKLSATAAFEMALSGAGRHMGRAAALLGRLQTGTPTQLAQQNAVRRLEMLLDALKAEEAQTDSDTAGGGQGKPGGAPPGGVATMAELKLMKLMQLEINLRTDQLQETVARGEELTDQQRGEYAALAEEQGRLAGLLLQLLPEEDPADDPEDLPDVRRDREDPPEESPEEEESRE